MKKLFILLTTSFLMGNLQSLACVEHVTSAKPKFKAGDCLENTPDDEFQNPTTIQIVKVGQKRYQYIKYDNDLHSWSEYKDDDIFDNIDRNNHKASCTVPYRRGNE